MPRRYLRRVLPSALHVREYPLVKLFGGLLQNPDLWHLNRHSVALAVAVGLFVAFMPVPAQMLLAAAIAIGLGCNLSIAVVIVWVSNPITMGPMFFAAYKLGATLLEQAPAPVKFEISVHWLLTELGAIWEPFLLGCFLIGTFTALAGYVTVQVIWRIHVISSWRERRHKRNGYKARDSEPSSDDEPL